MSIEEHQLQAAAELRRGATRLTRRLRQEGPPRGLSPNKLNVLSHLYRHGPLHPGQLAELEHVQPQSLTRVLAELEESGLIRRMASEADRRQSVIDATPEGLRTLGHDMESRDVWLADALESLSPTER